jgi:hypothetical protein
VSAGADSRAASGERRQSLFRDVNERVDAVVDGTWADDEETEYICECTDTSCTERIRLPADRYDRVRENARWFVVAPANEHVRPEIERVVVRAEGYWVVEKVGDAGAVAESLDPRADEEPH